MITQLAYAEDQSYSIRYYTTADGLSQNEVTSITQDKYGFMWFGTSGGLNRFDGYEFIQYKPVENDETSLHSPSVESLYAAKDGNIWIGTGSEGYSIYDINDGIFINKNKESSTQFNRILSFYEDGNKMWIGGWRTNTIKIDKHTYAVESEIKRRSASAFALSDNGQLWFGASNGVFQISNDTVIWPSRNIRRKSVTGMIIDKNEECLWIVGWSLDLIKYYYKTGEWTSFKPKDIGANLLNTFRLCQDDNGTLWVGTWGNGLYTFNTSTEKFKKIDTSIYGRENLSQIIRSVFVDAQGEIWVGTGSSGVMRISPTKSFKSIELLNSDTEALFIKSITKDKSNNLLFGSNDGLYISKYHDDFVLVKPKGDAIKMDNFYHTHISEDGQVFAFANTDAFVVKADEKSNFYLEKASEVFDSPIFDELNKVRDVLSLGNELWVATQERGLFYLQKENGRYSLIRNFLKSDAIGSLNSNRITHLNMDASGRMLVSTHSGMYVYNRGDSTFTNIEDLIDGGRGLLCNIINSVYSEDGTQIWFGTPCGLGVLSLNGDGLFDLTQFTTHHGLSDDFINGVLVDDNGMVWMSTNIGISKLNPASNKVWNYDQTDGINDCDFIEKSCYKSEDGILYFGANTSVTYFDPNTISGQTPPPSVVLTDLKVLNKSVRVQDGGQVSSNINDIEEIVLNYKQKELSFIFATLDYKAPEQNLYKYWLEGYNEEWFNIGTRRHISFNNLDPGTYNLHINGTDNHGVWSENDKVIAIKVLTPYWKTWYAILFYTAFIMSIVILIGVTIAKRERMSNSISLAKLEREKEVQINEYKLRFFTDISHEMRTPLTLILAPIKELRSINFSELTAKTFEKKVALIDNNSSRLYNLVNQLLEFRKAEAGKLEVKVVAANLDKFLKRACQGFVDLAQEKEVVFKQDYNLSGLLVFFDKERMGVIMSNLLSNAFKYVSDKGLIEVSTHDLNDAVEIRVRNTGKGISPEEKEHLFDRFYQSSGKFHLGSSGIGLSLAKSYVEIHKGHIEVESVPNQYITFIVTLKKGAGHFLPNEIVEGDVSDFKQPMVLPHVANNVTQTKSANNKVHGTSVLIVEDNDQLRGYLEELLSDHFNVGTASDGVEGFNEAIKSRPDLIISDIMMPHMDGYEMCDKVKNNDLLKHIPILLLSAKGMSHDKLFGIRKGADAYLTKPFEPSLLIETAKQLIASRKQMRETYSKNIKIEASDKDITKGDEVFLSKVMNLIDDNIDDSDLNPAFLAQKMAMSNSTFYRKIKHLTQKAPGEIIRTMRLTKAEKMLVDTSLSITEIMEKIGVLDSKTFRHNFKASYGYSPMEYRSLHKKTEG